MAGRKNPSQHGTPEERDDKLLQVISMMESGMSAFKACKTLGIPFATFSLWTSSDPQKTELYARAKDEFVANMAQELADIADEPPPLGPDGKVDSGWIQKHRLQVDTRKWLLSKLAPKKYGDRLEVAGDASSPLQAAVTVSFVTAAKKGDE